MSSFELFCHPDSPCVCANKIQVELALNKMELILLYRIFGNIDVLTISDPGQPCFKNGLWQHTCLEAFIKHKDSAGQYLELNFSPSSEWAAYSFDAYREGMVALDAIHPPVIATSRQEKLLQVSVSLPLDGLGIVKDLSDYHLALASVIEDHNGMISYWAGKPRLDKPDFHHPDNFCFPLAC